MTATLVERTLPHNLEAEKAVLGACLMNPEAFGAAAEILRSDDFFRDAHRRLFEVMRQLAEGQSEIDTVTVKNVLVTRGDLEQVGGAPYVAALTDGVPRSLNVGHYARIVKDKSDLRALIHAATKIQQAAYEGDDPSREILSTAERTLFELAGRTTRGGFKSLKELMPLLLDKIEQASKSGTGITGLATGLRNLDDMTRGLQPSNLILIAARPSIGKSALALNIAINVALQGKAVGIFSLEMSDEELGIRALAAEARVDAHRVQGGLLGQRDWGKLAQAMGTLAELPVWIDDTPFVNAFDIRTRTRRLLAEHGLDLLIVDYAQLVSGDGGSDTRALELGQVSRTFKAIAKELRVPVIALSQLSRKVEERTDKRPILSDLRESGALEQDADLVIFIHREERYHEHPDPAIVGLAELIIAKHRNGPIGTVKLSFVKEFARFEDLHIEPSYADRRLPGVDE